MKLAPVFFAKEHVAIRDEDGIGELELVGKRSRIEWRGEMNFEGHFGVQLAGEGYVMAAGLEKGECGLEVGADFVIGEFVEESGVRSAAQAHHHDHSNGGGEDAYDF
jgi:hypothetical protein